MKAFFSGALACLCLLAPVSVQAEPSWRGYAGNAQHTAPALAKAQKLKTVHWHTPVDLHPSSSTLIHYASPMITASNTVLLPVKTGPSNGFQMEAHSAKKGTLLWKATTDFVFAPYGSWMPSFSAHLTAQNRFYYAGAGGTVYYRDTPDLKTGANGQIAFFGNANYAANKAAYNSHVMIDTPITADESGNIYFGFVVTGSTPLGLKSGIARIGADGQGSWISAANAAGDSDIVEVAQNCAPAISADQSTVYIGVSNASAGYLVGLDSATLAQKYKVRLKDPLTHNDAVLLDASTASPTVGPDGDVYYGIYSSDFGHNGRGWLAHYSGDLSTTKTPGSFGWDNTAAVVPASAVASYTGSSAYLLMTKYNNYLDAAPNGDGHNEIAIIDPNAQQKDRFSNVQVMKEIMTKLGPTQVKGEPKGVVFEWCINSAVVDVEGKAVVANSEDGHTYRWDLTTGKLQGISLNAPTFEAYTPTEIGPDGTVYAINNATLYALGK